MLIDFVQRDVTIVDAVVILNLHDPIVDTDECRTITEEHVLVDRVVDDVNVAQWNIIVELDERALEFQVNDFYLHVRVIHEFICFEQCRHLREGTFEINQACVIQDEYYRCLLRLEVFLVHELVNLWRVFGNVINIVVQVALECITLEYIVLSAEQVDRRGLLFLLLVLHGR